MEIRSLSARVWNATYRIYDFVLVSPVESFWDGNCIGDSFVWTLLAVSRLLLPVPGGTRLRHLAAQLHQGTMREMHPQELQSLANHD